MKADAHLRVSTNGLTSAFRGVEYVKRLKLKEQFAYQRPSGWSSRPPDSRKPIKQECWRIGGICSCQGVEAVSRAAGTAGASSLAHRSRTRTRAASELKREDREVAEELVICGERDEAEMFLVAEQIRSDGRAMQRDGNTTAQ